MKPRGSLNLHMNTSFTSISYSNQIIYIFRCHFYKCMLAYIDVPAVVDEEVKLA